MQEILSLKNCSFAYEGGDFQLKDVSLSIHSGRMYGITGPNGSGKSTLLRIMARITKPLAGNLGIHGKAIDQYSRREFAREVAFLPQNPSPSFDLTVREVVSLGRYPYQSGLGLLDSHDERIIERTLQETECEMLAERFFSTLSGGERQRVLIAGVLAQEPSIVMLDEPSASLDIHHKSHVFDLLWSLSRSGIAVVVVTHDLNMAGEFCDRLIMLSDGTIACRGEASEVMKEDTLSRIYGARIRVIPHPLTSAPMVTVIGKKFKKHRYA